MSWEPKDEFLIRRYLLKQASEEEEQTVEMQMLRDDDYAELVELIEDEMIDDYARGVMGKAESSVFLTSLSANGIRRQKLIVAETSVQFASRQQRNTREHGNQGVWRLLFVPSWKPVVWASLAILLAIVGYRQITEYRRDIEQGMGALNQAFSQERPLRVRITGMNYAPFSVRLGTDNDRVDLTARNRAERLFLDAVRDSQSPESHHALGRFYLVEKKLDDAIQEFETALKALPNNAELHSDLGAALLERANREVAARPSADPALFDRSLIHLNRALELNDESVEALFNRGLLYLAVGQPANARDDLRRYLQKDSGSPWAAEARNYIRE